MVRRVSLKGLYDRISLQGLSWGDQIQCSGQSGGTTILGGPLTARHRHVHIITSGGSHFPTGGSNH